MNPEISVVIVTWNCERFIAGCLASIVGELPENSEVIVVDNASTDGTLDLVRRFFPSVNLVESQKNLGFAGGNNLGLRAANGQYVCLINPDVVIREGCIHRMIQYMDQTTDVGLLGPKIVGSDGAVQRSCMRAPTFWNQLCRALALDTLTKQSGLFGGYLMNDFPHQEVRDVDVVNGCFWMVRRAALKEVGLLDSRFWMYGEDLDWCRRYNEAGWRVVFFPASEALHFGGGSSAQAPLSCCIEMMRADLQYWRKYHNGVSYLAYFAILFSGHVLRLSGCAFLYLLPAPGRSHALSRLRKHLACVRWLTLRRMPADRNLVSA
jgi:GT2 family glycosyltransferase